MSLIVIALCLLILDLSQKFKLKWGLIWLMNFRKECCWQFLCCRGLSLTKKINMYIIYHWLKCYVLCYTQVIKWFKTKYKISDDKQERKTRFISNN